MSPRATPTIEPTADRPEPDAERRADLGATPGDHDRDPDELAGIAGDEGDLEEVGDEDEYIEYGPIATAELRVDESTVHGTGVFAERAYEPDEIIERCPVLVLSTEEAWAIADTALGDYVYEWEGGCAVALGFGSLYNHSRTSNARYEMDYDLVEIDVVAVRAIAPGDEIFINYNGDPTITDPVWFETE